MFGAFHVSIVVCVAHVCQSEVNAPVVRHASLSAQRDAPRCAVGQTFRPYELQVSMQLRQLGQVVLKEHGKLIPLLLRCVQPAEFRVIQQLFARTHGAETDPTVCSGHQLAVQLQVQADRVAAHVVRAGVTYTHVIDRVTRSSVHVLGIRLGGEFERATHGAEVIIRTEHELRGACGFQFVVEANTRDAETVGHRIAHLLVERCLVVQAGGYTETDVTFPAGNDHHRCTWRDEHLVVETPPVQPCAAGQYDFGMIRMPGVGVLQVRLHASAEHSGIGAHGVVQLHSLFGMWHGVSSRVAPLPLAYAVGDLLYLSAHAPAHAVGVVLPLARVLQRSYAGGQGVARMLVIGACTEYGGGLCGLG